MAANAGLPEGMINVCFEHFVNPFERHIGEGLVFPQIGQMEVIFFKIISTLTFLNLISLLFENRFFFIFYSCRLSFVAI